MVSQIAASPPVIRLSYSRNLVSDSYHVSHFSQFILQIAIAIVTIWNLKLTPFEAGMDISVFILT